MLKKIYWPVIFCFLAAASAQAAPPLSPYSPGQTLNPACTPGTANCTIIAPSVSGANSDITSLTGLTTPLSTSQGGTGLNAIGSAGQFFKISTSSLPAWETVGLNNIDGVLSFTKGGTGLSAIGSGELLYASGANTLSPLALSNELLINSGSLEVNHGIFSITASQVADFNASADSRITLQKAQLNGLATLDAGGKIPTAQLSSIAINHTYVVASTSDMIALAAEVGDMAVVTGANETYVLQSLPASTLGNWIELLAQASVSSVNTKTGAVSLTTTDIGEGTNLYLTDERVDDRVGALINDGIGIYKTYDDTANTLTLNINTSGISINSLGGTPLAANKGGTGLSSIATGDLIYGSGANTFSVLGAGSNDQILKMSGGLPVWGTDVEYTAGTGLNLAANSFTVDQSVLNLNNFANILGIDKGGTGQSTASGAINALAPLQTGQSGKFLTTNGATVSWAAVPGGITDHALLTNIGTSTHVQLDAHLINYNNPHQVTADQAAPLQTGQSGKFLTTNGATVSWAAVPGGITDHALLTNIGTNTHAQIDTHLAAINNPHSVTAVQIGAGGLIAELNTHGTTTIDWARISKATSSLADLITRNYSDLTGRPGDDDFHNLSAETAIAAADEVLLYSQANAGYRKMTRANLVAGLGAGSSTVWSTLTAPVANLDLTLNNYTTSFNFNSSTGANNMFSLTDAISNTGTGYLLNVMTAAGSTLKPFSFGAAGQSYLSMSSLGITTFGTSTSNLKIGSNGQLRLAGSATAWDDLRVPIATTKTGGASDPTFVQISNDGAGSRGVYAYSFPTNTAARELFFSTQLPHVWLEGSDIRPHVHWAPSDATAGNVMWGLECTWTNITDTIGTTTVMTATSSALGAKRHTLGVVGVMSGLGKTISSVLSCRVFRDSNNVLDTYNAAAYLTDVDFHYQVDSFGSDTVASKTY